jgi:FkbM family methyltransferase
MKQFLRSVLARLGYEVRGVRLTPRPLRVPENLVSIEFDDAVCRRIVENGANFRFLQVGVFDGVTADPLRKYISRYGWRGVMVEPQAQAANALRALYPLGAGIEVMQAAVDRAPGRRTLHTVVSDTAPAWVAGLASFNRSVILKHAELIPDLAQAVREEEVALVTFDDVLARPGPGEIDLLQIDTEGADALILSLFPFERVRPAIVHWEVKHLSLTEREATLDRLIGHGYRVASSGTEDMLAVLR